MRKNMDKFILTLFVIIGLGMASFYAFAMKAISDSSYDTANLTQGKTAYVSNCIVCHGDQGRGDGPASDAMAVKPDNIYLELINPFGFKAELIGSVMNGDNGQNGTMPAFKEVLSKKEIVDIFAYIISLNEAE